MAYDLQFMYTSDGINTNSEYHKQPSRLENYDSRLWIEYTMREGHLHSRVYTTSALLSVQLTLSMAHIKPKPCTRAMALLHLCRFLSFGSHNNYFILSTFDFSYIESEGETKQSEANASHFCLNYAVNATKTADKQLEENSRFQGDRLLHMV